MRQHYSRLLLTACGALLVVFSPAWSHAADDVGQSTVRTVSVSGSTGQRTAAQDTLPSHQPRNRPTRFAPPTDRNANTSSIGFVAPDAATKPVEPRWVRQAQHIVEGPNAADATSSRSSFVIEPEAFVLPEPAGNDASSFEPLASSSEALNVVSSETVEHSPVKSPRADVAAPAPKTPPQSNVHATNRAQHGIYYFGDNSTRTTLSQMPRRTPIQPGAAPAPRQRAKPFQSIEHEPTVSPYLNLYRNDEDTESAPNYYAFVRPQMEQLESSRRQQMEILRLQRQMQNASSTVVRPQQRSAAVPNSGTAARYMDTAQFYGAWQR